MSASSKWAFVCSLLVLLLVACTNNGGNSFADDSDAVAPPSGDDAASPGSGSSGGFAALTLSNDAAPSGADPGPCKGGLYSGTFAGLYTSHLTGVGVPIPVAGNVDMKLNQAGSAGMTCTFVGESESCSNFFELKDGTISGVADAIHAGDASIGGFPYFCTMTGTLDCKAKKLLGGWIQCTYCVGDLADGGMACSLLNGVAGTTGVGGHFAGPLTASYDYSTLSFVMGTWNGAEALAGNDGGSPGPDGGPISDYLSDSGLYLGPNDFGGSGTWNAKHL